MDSTSKLQLRNSDILSEFVGKCRLYRGGHNTDYQPIIEAANDVPKGTRARVRDANKGMMQYPHVRFADLFLLLTRVELYTTSHCSPGCPQKLFTKF